MNSRHPGRFTLLALLGVALGIAFSHFVLPHDDPQPGNPNRLHREVRADSVTPAPDCIYASPDHRLVPDQTFPCRMQVRTFGGSPVPSPTPCPTSPDPALVGMQTQTSDDFGTRWVTWGCPYFVTATAEGSS